MKVISAKEMAHLESLAYRDGASESDFMEEAGSGIALIVHDYIERHPQSRSVVLVCGKGNNAGDGYVAGIQLLSLDYEVIAYQIIPITECSRLCKASYQRFLQAGGRVLQINSAEELAFPPEGVIVDALFGTGFEGSVSEPYATIIARMNSSNLPIIAADIPSGLNGMSGAADEHTVIATETAFLGLPKTGFFLLDGWDCVGKLRFVDFGLPQIYIEEADSDMVMLSSDFLRSYLPKIKRSRHKYQAGSVVGIAGSSGMSGAAILSASAALRAGAGIVYLLYPEGMEVELCAAPFELIKIPYSRKDLKPLIDLANKASSVFIGPGMGRHPEVAILLQELLPQIKVPCVIDADALTLMGSKSIVLPAKCVLTPHHAEMNRLLGDERTPPLTMKYLQRCQRFAVEKKIILVLKGAPSFVLGADMPIYVSSRGDPGMATAGSGDLLTGLIAALMAQKVSPEKAAQLGVYIHSLAGEFAANELTSYCMTAGDLLYHFPEGFLFQEE